MAIPQPAKLPSLVACEPSAKDGDNVVGFASFGNFRAWPGYRFTVEHTVHVHAGWRGKGIGSALVQALIPRAATLGKHVIIGGIDAENVSSLRFHERLGFERVAHFKEVGFRFGRILALERLGWRVQRQRGSHRFLTRPNWPDYEFAFHDHDEIGPRMRRG